MAPRAVCLSKVDLPPMFGPVTRSNDWPALLSRRESLGMKFFLPERVTQG